MKLSSLENTPVRVSFLCLVLFSVKELGINCQPLNNIWDLSNGESNSALDSISSETDVNYINSDVTKRGTTRDLSCVNCRALKVQCFHNTKVIEQIDYYNCARMCVEVCRSKSWNDSKRSKIDKLETHNEIEQFYDWLMSIQ